MDVYFDFYNHLDKIDLVLSFLAKSPFAKGHNSDVDILNFINKNKCIISAGELIKILNKLIKDEYVDSCLKDDIIGLEIKYYFITWEGQVFFEMGGYKTFYLKEFELKKIQQQQDKIIKTNFLLTLIIALGALVASLYYIMEIYKYFVKTH